MPTATAIDSLRQYASVCWQRGDLIEIRPLPVGSGRRIYIPVEDFPKHIERMETENMHGANLYAGIIPRTREAGEDEDCAQARVLWADFDKCSANQARVKAIDMPEPSLIVNSGHGAHFMWRLDAPLDCWAAARAVSAIARAVDADPSVGNPSRILRLPGFTNHKPPAAPCEIVQVARSNVYALDALMKCLPAAPVTAPAINLTKPPTCEVSLYERATRYIAKIPHVGEGQRNEQAYRVACAAVNDFALPEGDAFNALAAWNMGNSPPLDEKELRITLKSASRHAQKPAGAKAVSIHPLPRPAAPAKILPRPPLGVVFDNERSGKNVTVPMPWPLLGNGSRALRAGTVCLLAGPAGYGKSIMTMQMAVHCHRIGERIAYLPLEDTKVDFERRLLAHLAKDWIVLDDDSGSANVRMNYLEQHAQTLAEYGEWVSENPRLPQIDESGAVIVPELPKELVIAWAEEKLKTCRVVFIDPLAQVDFFSTQPWREESAFIRSLLALASHHGGTVVLVAHTVKRPGKGGLLPMSAEDVQGAANLTRLVQTVIILEAHDAKKQQVKTSDGEYLLEHTRTVLIAKARNAKGTFSRIAFNMAAAAMVEEGLITGGEK